MRQKKKSSVYVSNLIATAFVTVIVGVFITSLAGCASNKDITLNVISGESIVPLRAGETFTAPTNGYFIANEIFEDVAGK